MYTFPIYRLKTPNKTIPRLARMPFGSNFLYIHNAIKVTMGVFHVSLEFGSSTKAPDVNQTNGVVRVLGQGSGFGVKTLKSCRNHKLVEPTGPFSHISSTLALQQQICPVGSHICWRAYLTYRAGSQIKPKPYTLNLLNPKPYRNLIRTLRNLLMFIFSGVLYAEEPSKLHNPNLGTVWGSRVSGYSYNLPIISVCRHSTYI